MFIDHRANYTCSLVINKTYIPEVAWSIATKLCYVFDSDPDLWDWVRNLGTCTSPFYNKYKIWRPVPKQQNFGTISDNFATPIADNEQLSLLRQSHCTMSIQSLSTFLRQVLVLWPRDISQTFILTLQLATFCLSAQKTASSTPTHVPSMTVVFGGRQPGLENGFEKT